MSKKFTPGKAGASKTIQQKIASKAKGRGEKLKPFKKKGPLKESMDPGEEIIKTVQILKDKGLAAGFELAGFIDVTVGDTVFTAGDTKGNDQFSIQAHKKSDFDGDSYEFDKGVDVPVAATSIDKYWQLSSEEQAKIISDAVSAFKPVSEDWKIKDDASVWSLQVTFSGIDDEDFGKYIADAESDLPQPDDISASDATWSDLTKEEAHRYDKLISIIAAKNDFEVDTFIEIPEDTETSLIGEDKEEEEEGDTENPDAPKEGEEEEEESDVDVIDINPEAFYVKLESEETLKLIGPFDSEDEASAYMKENEIPEDSAEVVQGLGSDDEEASDDSEGDEQEDEEESDNGVPKNLPGLDINPLEDIITKPPHEDEEELDEDEEEDCDCNESYQSQLQTLIESDNTLTESFKKKAAVIFESAVATKVQEEKAKLKKNFDKHLTERVARVNQTLSDKIDSYLSYAVESWVESNKVAIDQSLRTEIAENFIDSLKGVFNEHYIEVPKAKVNVVTRLESKVTKLEESLQTTEKAKRSLASKVVRLEKEKVISEASKGLATTQSAKLQSLVEGVTFTSPEDFKKKVSVIRESHFANKRPSTTQRFADTKKQTVRTGSIYESTEIQESNQFAKTNDGDEVSSTIAQAAKILSLNENRS